MVGINADALPSRPIELEQDIAGAGTHAPFGAVP